MMFSRMERSSMIPAFGLPAEPDPGLEGPERAVSLTFWPWTGDLP